MKRSTAAVIASAFILSTASCSSFSSDSGSHGSANKKVNSAKLVNHMSDTERSRLSEGPLTVFDHEQKDDGVVPSEGIYLEMWDAEDYADYYEHYNEHNSEFPMTDDEIKEAVEYTRDAEGDIKYAG